MDRPGFITIVKKSEIKDSLFEDLQISKILSTDAINVLKWVCDIGEIKKRHSIFAAMENESFCELLEKCGEAILDFDKSKELLNNAIPGIEVICLTIRVLEAYINFCKNITELKGYCRLTDMIAEFFLLPENSRLTQEISCAVVKARNALAEISEFCLTFSDSNWISPSYSGKSYYERVAECAQAMGFDIPSQRTLAVRADAPVSKAYTQLFSDKVGEAEKLISPYSDIIRLDFSGDRTAINFYLEIKELIRKAESYNIPHTLPVISENRKIRINNVYDITLLAKQVSEIVPNDAFFDTEAPFFFLTGANGGGKTTYLRAVGVNTVLFLAGCPVFADHAEIYPLRYIDVHFPKDERFTDTGRLDEEKQRVRDMLDRADSDGILLFNETFSGTDDELGCALTLSTAGKMREKSVFGLYVTHYHEVSGKGFPLLHAEVEDTHDEKNKRIYRIVRADGRTMSYAKDILRKYKLDRKSLLERGRKNDQPS